MVCAPALPSWRTRNGVPVVSAHRSASSAGRSFGQVGRRIAHGPLGAGVSMEVVDIRHVGACAARAGPLRAIEHLVGGEHGPSGPARGSGERRADAVAGPGSEGFGIEEGAGGIDAFGGERDGRDPGALAAGLRRGSVLASRKSPRGRPGPLTGVGAESFRTPARRFSRNLKVSPVIVNT